MTRTIHIIDTATIQPGDLVAFMFGEVETAGIVKEIGDCGDYIVKTAGFGVLNVSQRAITDIC